MYLGPRVRFRIEEVFASETLKLQSVGGTMTECPLRGGVCLPLMEVRLYFTRAKVFELVKPFAIFVAEAENRVINIV